MRNIIKSFCFVIIFLVLLFLYIYLVMPKYNMDKYNMLDIAEFEILEEKKDTIDVLFVGDSLVYSGVSPMEIWNEYGITSFDCATPAQLIETSYNYIEKAIDTQHPKVIFLEANVIFRDAKKRKADRKWDDFENKYIFIDDYHDNWKSVFFGEGIININKGYVYINKTVKADKSFDYMEKKEQEIIIPEINFTYFEKIVKLCEDNNIKLILFSIPSMKSWNYAKDVMVMDIKDKYNLEYIDLNMNNPLEINWEKETKDKGSHLNYISAKKVSHYLGNYIVTNNLAISHKDDSNYSSWNKSYEKYIKQLDID